jgi:hypothetical protein
VRLRPGRDAVLVDLGAGGALIEGAARLHPGSTVVLQLVGSRRSAFLTGTVLRCQVSAIDREAGVRYRGAISFDIRLEFTPQEPSRG